MKPWVMALMLLLAVPLGAQGFQPGSKDLMKRDADAGLPPSPYAAKPLPELKGVVSWKTLADVKTLKQKDRFIPDFGRSVSALDRQEVKLQGFMMPLEMGERQKRFLLVALPPTCAFCMPGGPEQVVEVRAKTPVKYGFEPIVVSGRLALLRNDEMGLYYRLTDAAPVGR
ncbi:MAG: DUF3299 domain-containing protein [Burkholderiales bacterium]|nr:DUF3299 domain-containing protein [Burkholderiales bacterium]